MICEAQMKAMPRLNARKRAEPLDNGIQSQLIPGVKEIREVDGLTPQMTPPTKTAKPRESQIFLGKQREGHVSSSLRRAAPLLPAPPLAPRFLRQQEVPPLEKAPQVNLGVELLADCRGAASWSRWSI